MDDPQVFARNFQKRLKGMTPQQQIALAKSFLDDHVPQESRQFVEIVLMSLLEGKREPSLVIVLLHGIRTNAQWQDQAVQILEKEVGAIVVPIKYGAFDLFRFWFPLGLRRGPISRILRELRTIQADKATTPMRVVAHSFGTYSISRILLQHTDVKVSHLLLCGSIIKDGFRWDRLPRCPEKILNMCGTEDIWPIFAKSTTWGYGSSGSFGFGTARVDDVFFDVGHSGFFEESFIRQNWVPFLLSGTKPESQVVRPETPWPKLVAQIIPGQWLLLTAALVVTAYAAL